MRTHYEDLIMKEQSDKERTKKDLENELEHQKSTLENSFNERMATMRAELRMQTAELAREGLRSQLEKDHVRDELALVRRTAMIYCIHLLRALFEAAKQPLVCTCSVSDDATNMRKLLQFWKNKLTVMKQSYDDTERALQ
eukprot:gene2454-2052_t